MQKKLFFLLFSLALPAAALQLSLEENKGESGTVGYVDIDRVFKEFSGTGVAKEEFQAEIKKKEDSVNTKKKEIYTLKAAIAKLREEKEFALTLPAVQALKAAPPAVKTEPPASHAINTASAPVAAVQLSSSIIVNSSSTTEAPLSSTTIVAAANTQSATLAETATPIVPNTPMPLSSLPGLGIDMPGVEKVPVEYFKFTISTSAADIEAAIVVKEKELADKEAFLKIYKKQVEKELLEYEKHRSEIILGKIYLALKDLAAREGVSVIEDKRSILFGHGAVDLTDKLIALLEESQ